MSVLGEWFFRCAKTLRAGERQGRLKFGPVCDRGCGRRHRRPCRARPGLTLKKGDVVRPADVETLRAAGVAEIVVARLETATSARTTAASARARRRRRQSAVRSAIHRTLQHFATKNGVLVLDPAAIDAVNALDEAITLATLPAMRASSRARWSPP